MRRQTLWRGLIAAFGFLLLYGGVAQAEIDPTMVQKLLAGDSKSKDYFSSSISMASDGNTALVGAYGAEAAYVFIRSADGSWIQQVKLTAADSAAEAKFGHSVSLSADGNTALIGAHEDGDKGKKKSGSAYVFTRAADGSWMQQAKLTAADGAVDDYFGDSVSVSADGNTALIGAFLNENENKSRASDPLNINVYKSNASGSVYVFTRAADGSWMQQAKLTAADGAVHDIFGGSVSISANGNTALIGAHGEDGQKGAVYVFVRTADGSWTQQAKLVAADKAAQDRFAHVSFGLSVSISVDGNTAFIGAAGDTNNQGSAYVFVRAADGSWTQQAKLTAADSKAAGKSTGALFGVSVSVSGDGNIAVIGAHSAYGLKGAAYVFVRADDGSWTQQAKLTAADRTAADYYFGNSVSISGNGRTALIGEVGKGNGYGAAYIYRDFAHKIKQHHVRHHHRHQHNRHRIHTRQQRHQHSHRRHKTDLPVLHPQYNTKRRPTAPYL